MRSSEYDKFAGHFDATRRQPWKEVTDFLWDLKTACDAPRRPGDIRLLDIGCGNGRHLIEAEKRGLNAFGLDISRNLLKIAKRKARAPLILGNALKLPFKDGVFENALCIAVVHHFGTEKERKKCLEEMARVTRRSCIVSVWAFEQEKFKGRKTQNIKLGWDGKFPRFYHLFKEGELENLAKNAGLNVKKAWREGNNYWAVIDSVL